MPEGWELRTQGGYDECDDGHENKDRAGAVVPHAAQGRMSGLVFFVFAALCGVCVGHGAA